MAPLILLAVLVLVFIILAAIPVCDWVLSGVGLGILSRPVEGLILAGLAWRIIAGIKPEEASMPRVFGAPTPLTFVAVGIVAIAWWDPFGWFGHLAVFLAGEGAMRGFIDRGGRGLLTFSALALLVRSLRPTADSVVRKRARGMRTAAPREPKDSGE